ncbi:hypothetical protein CBW18_11720 [Pedobacter sp. AJM]|nr:hypothetical protein CBW18_11720 [Pedobacter sp. AJM]
MVVMFVFYGDDLRHGAHEVFNQIDLLADLLVFITLVGFFYLARVFAKVSLYCSKNNLKSLAVRFL